LKSFFLFFFSVFICSTAIAQPGSNKTIIAGNIIDADNGKVIEGATVSIQLMNDTSVAEIFVTDANGEFQFNELRYGYYRLRVKMTGYASLRTDSIFLREERTDFNLPDLKLIRSASEMESVTVYAEKPNGVCRKTAY